VTFLLSSSAFEDGASIPARYTCEDENVSPPLSWTTPPEGTRSLALAVDDPDAPVGTWTHWLGWGIAPGAGQLAEGEGPRNEGLNDFGQTGYGGPCPPRGHGPHRYVFRLYALEGPLDLPRGATKWELERSLAGRVLAVAELVGIFERR
jgi:Raf kinase inhibitor-like YbhB/YbcL family protein